MPYTPVAQRGSGSAPAGGGYVPVTSRGTGTPASPPPKIAPPLDLSTSGSSPQTVSPDFVGPFTGVTKVRPIGLPAGSEAEMGGGFYGNLVTNLIARGAELPFKVATQFAANVSKTGKIETPFDATRLGFSDPKQVQNTYQRGLEDFNAREAADAKAGKTSLINRAKNAALASLNSFGADTMDAFASGAIVEDLAKVSLTATKFNPEVTSALQQLDLKPSEVSWDRLRQEFMDRAKVELERGNIKGANDVAQATGTLVKALTGEGIPQLNKFGEIVQGTSRALLSDVRNLGVADLATKPLGSKAPAPEELPGYRPVNERSPIPVGLSTEPVEPVGFGETPKGPTDIVPSVPAESPASMELFKKSLTPAQLAIQSKIVAVGNDLSTGAIQPTQATKQLETLQKSLEGSLTPEQQKLYTSAQSTELPSSVSQNVKPLNGNNPINSGDIVSGFRGNPGTGVSFGATEGKGVYVSKDQELAGFFAGDEGLVGDIKFRWPKQTEVLSVINEPLPLLDETYPLFDPIKKTDSEWIKLNKEAATNVGATSKNWPRTSGKVEVELDRLIRAKGYKVVDIEGGFNNSWVVVLDNSLIQSEEAIARHGRTFRENYAMITGRTKLVDLVKRAEQLTARAKTEAPKLNPKVQSLADSIGTQLNVSRGDRVLTTSDRMELIRNVEDMIDNEVAEIRNAPGGEHLINDSQINIIKDVIRQAPPHVLYRFRFEIASVVLGDDSTKFIMRAQDELSSSLETQGISYPQKNLVGLFINDKNWLPTAFHHEFAHHYYAKFLSADERGVVDKAWESVKNDEEALGLLFEDRFIMDHYADKGIEYLKNEFFARAFEQYSAFAIRAKVGVGGTIVEYMKYEKMLEELFKNAHTEAMQAYLLFKEADYSSSMPPALINIFENIYRPAFEVNIDTGEVKLKSPEEYIKMFDREKTMDITTAPSDAFRSIAKATPPEGGGDMTNNVNDLLGQKTPQEQALEAAKAGEQPPGGKVPSSLEKLGLKPKPDIISRPEDVLLRQRIRDESRGAKAGAKEARRLTREDMMQAFRDSQKSVRETQKMLIQYIQENLPASAQGKFINSLLANLGEKKQASIFSRVNRLREDIQRRQIIGELKEVPRGEIAVDYQKKVREMMSDLDLTKPTNKTIDRLKSLRDYISQNGVPLGISPDRLAQLDRLTKVNVVEMTTDELREVRDAISTLRSLGELKLELKNKYNANQRTVALDKLLASSRNVDPKINRENGRLSQWDTWKVETTRAYMSTIHTPRVADMIDGYKNYAGENARYVKELNRAETTAIINTRSLVTDALKEITDLGFQTLDRDQQIRLMINIRQLEGATDQVRILQETYGIPNVPELSPQEQQLINILQKYTNRNTDQIAAIYEETQNTIFPRLKNYILPIKYERELNITPSATIEQNRYRTTKTFQGFTEQRQKGVERLPRIDVVGVFEEAIHDQQWYLNIEPKLEDLRYIVKTPEYASGAGELASQFWRDLLDVTARRGWSATAKSSPLLRQLRLNLGQATLGYKIGSILMQPFAVFDALAYTQAHYGSGASIRLLAEFAKTWVSPHLAKETIAESGSLQVRQGGELAVEEIKNALSEPPTGRFAELFPGVSNAIRLFQRQGMALLQKADVITAAGVERSMLKIMTDAGAQDPQREADFLMDMVSSSSEVTMRPLILSKGEGSRLMYTFQTFAMNRWGVIIHDLINAGGLNPLGGSSSQWSKKFSAIVGLMILVAGYVAEQEARKKIYEITTGNSLGKDSTATIAMMAIPEQIPFFGNIITTVRQRGEADVDFPLFKVIEDTFTGAGGVLTKATPEGKIKSGVKAAKATTAALLGIPGSNQFFELMNNIFTAPAAANGAGGLPSLPRLPSLPSLPKLPQL